ncbi:cobalt/nickel transport system permease protein [Aliiruegeria haliotis]|uniref:Cobalt/nickel transport system permease protein n=1 Tax=Aliiruegeria haliotis TaxID=1280846 RepID=A0A2T0RYB4_9RHOB|nr:cobalt ECF transporter T component CbiQ [Aliiruegeria haliotis]PRY26175.1 cobalt/nickel transport system permease protein [Aliiruegeria haliotis]
MSPVFTTLDKPLNQTGGREQLSWLGRIDPRARILAALAFAITIVACDSFPVLIGGVLMALLLLVNSRLPARRTLKRMATMDSFILFILVLLPFTVPGEPMFTVMGLTASWEGLWQAVEIGLKANAVILALMALVGTMEPVTLGHALHGLKVPETLVHLLMFTVRYIDVLREEYLRLRQAMKARGFRPATSWHSYRSFGYLVGMMLVRSMERSERILGAMKCRGFTGRITLLDRHAYGARDAVFAAGIALLLVSLVIAEVSLGAV